MAFKLDMTVDLCMGYMLMLISMTLTLMQGYSGLANETIQRWIILTTKQAISIKFAVTVGYDKIYINLKSSVAFVFNILNYNMQKLVPLVLLM